MTAPNEQFSKTEHELIQEVHPQVSEIKPRLDTVAEAVATHIQNSRRLAR